MKIVEDVKYDFQDVLLLPKRSKVNSRKDVVLDRGLVMKHSDRKYVGVPIIAANMDHTGTIEMANALKPFRIGIALHKFYDIDTLTSYFQQPDSNQRTFYTLGTSSQDFDKFETFMQSMPTEFKEQVRVCVDIANGYSRQLIDTVNKIRSAYPQSIIMAGNVVTPDVTYDLLEAGADIVKVGIGSGSTCTTRRVTGVGYPQLSAVIECASAAHGVDGLICSDGGITCPGDMVKAFAAGADFVMGGGIFAGHTECSGEVIDGEIDWANIVTVTRAIQSHETGANDYAVIRTHGVTGDTQVHEYTKDWLGNTVTTREDPIPASFYANIKDARMRFYGMSSSDAMTKHYGGKAEYRSAEGKTVEVPFKGPVRDTVEHYLGGIRSACAYVGAARLTYLSTHATFIKVNRQLNESLSSYNV